MPHSPDRPTHRFAVLGAGALGSIIAAKLQRAGYPVQLIARGRRAEQLASQGLRIRGQLDADRYPFTALFLAVDPGQVDVKAYDNERAIEPLSDLQLSNVFSVANGVVKNDQLAAVFGADKLLGCMSDISGELTASGEVQFTRNVGLSIGAFDEPARSRAETVAAAISAADIPCEVRDNIEAVEWSKYIGWMGAMAASVLTRAVTGKFLSDPDAALLTARLMREGAQLAARRGIELIDQSPIPTASICAGTEEEAARVVQHLGTKFTEMAPGHRMSALQDLDKRRPLEIEQTLGYAVHSANEAGLAVPTLDTCYRLVAAVDRLNRQ